MSPNLKVNQILRERRQKLNRLAKFRKNKIIKRYEKLQQQSDDVLTHSSRIDPNNYPKQAAKLNHTTSKSQTTKLQSKQKVNEHTTQQMAFYNNLFKDGPIPARSKNNQSATSNGTDKKAPQEEDPSITELRMRTLKDRKKKLIKKMQTQKTPKGQPLMRNYIKYALTKLQEDREKSSQPPQARPKSK